MKVRDNNGTDAVSEPVKIFVDSKANPPTAAFTSSQVNGTKTIKFVNNSVVDEANGAKLKSYAWDFNVAVDSNGDGKADNDIDSPQKDPSAEYPEYGIYRAKLTVNDDQGGTISATNFVNVKAPTPPPAPAPTPTPTPTPAPGPTPNPTPGPQPQNTPVLDARLLTTPGATISDGKVHLQGDSADVTFDFSGSTGNIKSYIIDKNIYFDTNGNGVKDDDEDYKALTPGKWTTGFSKSFGSIRVRLTVFDATGKKDTVDKVS